MKDPRFAKLVLLINGLVPGGMVVWDALNGNAINPVEFAVRATGILTILFLILSLAVTPLRLAGGWNWLSNFRRMLGLFAFFYGAAHLVIFLQFQLPPGGVQALLKEMQDKPFIFAGMIALLLMLPLAWTSTAASVQRLGAKNWKRLHRLSYVSAIFGAIHGYMAFKADKQIPIVFAVVLGVLLLYRILAYWFPALKYKRSAPVRATPAA
jgi:sulfoxide reductase heme-binding subunit YedZ